MLGGEGQQTSQPRDALAGGLDLAFDGVPAAVEQVDDDGFAQPQSRVRVYYGAADTSVGLAKATIAELLEDARFQG